MSTSLLLVEDDAAIVRSLTPYLKAAGYETTVIGDGQEAADSFASLDPALVILDLNLPSMNGFDVCEYIRKTSTVPVMILSARSSEDDKVRALELGADDYIQKPFSPRELIARIAVVLKRSGINAESASTESIQVGSCQVDPASFTVQTPVGEATLTKTEFSLLVYLGERKGKVVERESIMRDVIGYDHYIADRTLDTHVKNIRKKLEGFLEIETIRGVGYKIS